MEAHASAGSRGEALRAYERCRRVLAEELGVRPSSRTEQAFETLLGEEPASPAATVLPLPAGVTAARSDVFVGRGPEKERLDFALKRAATEGRQAVFVAGEAGIGKTTLVANLARAAHARGARVLYGRSDEELGLPYQPFAEAFAQFVTEAPLAELESHVAVHRGELGRLVPELIRRLPGTPAPDVTDPEGDRYRLFNAVASLLSSACRAGPVVLIVEDLHWAAPPTVLLLRHLLNAAAAAKLLVIGTYRHTDIGPDHALTHALADLRREPAVDRLLLGGLDEEGVVAFVHAVRVEPGEDAVPLARAIHAHTAGNPFFVGELLRHLNETGATYRREGAWSYYADLDELGVPESVREVVARRLQRLSETAREALRWGAVIGAEFDLELLEAVLALPDADAVLDAVEEAVRAHVVAERGPGRYGFAHALVRDTIHAELTATRRARRHLAVAQALESLPRDDAHRLPALVHHFAEAATAGGAVKAADYAMAAARQAFAQSAWEDAVAFLDRGLEALEAQEPPDLERRCDLLIMLAETWCRFWDVPKMNHAAMQAVEISRALGSSERLARALRWSFTSVLGGDRRLIEELADEALAALGDDHLALRSLLLARRARPPYPDMTVEALDLARRSGDSEALGVALLARSRAVAETPRAKERLAIAEEMVSAAPPGGWDGWRGGYEQRAIARLVMGDRQGYEADTEATARLGREQRFWYYQREAILWQGTLALLDGRFDDAEQHAVAANVPGDRKVAAGTSVPIGDVYAIQMAKLAFERGQPEKAARVLQTALEQMPAHQLLRAMLAYAHAELGDGEQARHEFGVVAARATVFLTATRAYLAEVSATLEDAALAEPVYDQLHPFAGLVVASGQVAHCPGSVDRYLGQLAATLGRWDEAQAHYEIALRVDEGLQSPPLLARSRYWYGRMLLDHGDTNDEARAAELLTGALETAETLRMAGLAAGAQEQLDRLSTRFLHLSS